MNVYYYDVFGRCWNTTWDKGDDNQFVGGYGVLVEKEIVGLLYMRARYYDAKVGRFLTRDLWTYGPDDKRLFKINSGKELLKAFIFLGGLQNLKRLHRYMYAINNPISFIDYSGLVAITPELLETWMRENGISSEQLREWQKAIEMDKVGLDPSPNWIFIVGLGITIRVIGPFNPANLPQFLKWLAPVRQYIRIDRPHHGKGWHIDGRLTGGR